MLRWIGRNMPRIIAALLAMCFVLVAVGICFGQQDLSEIPAPVMGSSKDGGWLKSWWPIIMTVASLIVAAVTGVFAAWVKIRELKETTIAKIRVRQLEIDVEQRGKVFDMQQKVNEGLASHHQRMMETNATLLEKHESLLQENTKLKLEVDEAKDRLASEKGE